MLIFSSSLTPGRVKGSWIVLIWKIPACNVLNLVRPLSSNLAAAHDVRFQRGIWCHRTSASACFFGNDGSSRSRVRTRLITKCVYYEWASDLFAYPCPCKNSWYACAYPRVKKETGYPASRVASIFPRKIEGDSVRRVERGKSPWVNTGR